MAKQRTWNYNTAPTKKRKKYVKGGKVAALSMADNELAAELYPYLDDNPVAKIGLDAYLFEQGKMDPNDFEQKLLNIKTNPDRTMYSAAAMYNNKTDQILMNRLGNWYKTNPEITKEIPQKEIGFVEGDYDGKYGPKAVHMGAYGKKGQIKNLIHELTHRGANYLERAMPEYNKKTVVDAIERRKPIPVATYMLDDHVAMEIGDKKLADKFKIG